MTSCWFQLAALWPGGCVFDPHPSHTKNFKNGLWSFAWHSVLTLKMPRNPASENVVCSCCLLNILAKFSNLFLHTGKQCGPRSDCS